MKRIVINKNVDYEQVKQIIDKNEKAKTTFRYFYNRTNDCFLNHLYNVIFYNDVDPIGYCHLDKENDKIWFGIFICDDYTNKGFGTLITKHVLDWAKKTNIKNIYLTVDENNYPAIKMYEKFEFKFDKKIKENTLLYCLNMEKYNG